jgi:hypothetical protein
MYQNKTRYLKKKYRVFVLLYSLIQINQLRECFIAFKNEIQIIPSARQIIDIKRQQIIAPMRIGIQRAIRIVHSDNARACITHQCHLFERIHRQHIHADKIKKP